jgi:hypothetical protein
MKRMLVHVSVDDFQTATGSKLCRAGKVAYDHSQVGAATLPMLPGTAAR